MTRRITKTQARMLARLMDNGGITAVGDWTNGGGRYTTRRATPVCCEEMEIARACQLPGLSGRIARRLHRARPRVRSVIIVTDRRRANRIVGGGA